MTTPPSAPPISELPDRFRPLRRTEYEALVGLGVFEGQRVELVGGVLIDMAAHKPIHYGLILRLNKLLVTLAGDDWTVGAQGPVALDDWSEPEPDFSILPVADYMRAIPSDAVLVIEVANASLRFDLGEKARRYALRGYPEYWVFDVVNRVVHVHRDPQPDGSWASVVQQRDGQLTAVAAPQITLDLDDLLVTLPDAPDDVEP